MRRRCARGAVPAAAALAALAAAPVAGPADEWKQASPDYRLVLPQDHASHPDYRVEWWYYTGHVQTSAGRPFGYQLTFFRVGVDRRPANPSRWAVRDLHMAHFAITDIRDGRHLSAELLNRAGVGWAGADANRYLVWNEDWRARREDARHLLRASEKSIALDLELAETFPVLHGEQGFSQKGASPGNASHYYSMTRMPTRGRLRLGDRQFAVSGHSWMDHEFGTSFLEASQQGWDWFSLGLDDGTDLMLFQLRRRDGTVDPRSSGTIVAPGGTWRTLPPGDFSLEPGRTWRSPDTGGEYPVVWRVRVPAERLDLTVTPQLDAQEMRMAQSGVEYWEGAVAIGGRRRGVPVSGRGYLEMTGYAGGGMGDVLR